MLRQRMRGSVALGLLLVSACGHAATPTETADTVIRSIYAGDVAATRTAFDPTIRPAITPASMHELTERMRELGDYQSVVNVSTMAGRRYDFEAQFDQGSMLVQMRLAASGTVAAFHVVPNTFREANVK